MKIYVASSWRNPRHTDVVKRLEDMGHEVYDYRALARPLEEHDGRRGMTFTQMVQFMALDESHHDFWRDFDALTACDLLVCVLPCGRSAHLELGYAVGMGKVTILVWHDGDEPDIMHQAVSYWVEDDLDKLSQVVRWAERHLADRTR